jgi:poly-beta-1,6-N-acetyl-D-glucosamine synthase
MNSDAQPSYVLMSAAHNEELFIEGTIRSVLTQTILPKCWVIVSDASHDRTDEIVTRYTQEHSFIRFLRVDRGVGHNFESKVRALHNGCKLLAGVGYEYIGNLDTDISLDPEYFEELIKRFKQNPLLGIAAGFIYERNRGLFVPRASNRRDSVPHAAQLVRRSCYESIGGYAVLKYGGEDWHAQTSARMRGWQAESIPFLKVYHHRQTGRSTNLLAAKFRLGRLDHSFGSNPIFEFAKCARRIAEPPAVLGAAARLAGFVYSFISREPRPVSSEFQSFLRAEQMAKIAGLFVTRDNLPRVLATPIGKRK